MSDSVSDLKLLEMLYLRSYKTICRLITNVLSQYARCSSDAPDLAQEVFIQAAKKIEELQVHPNPEGWLMKVAYNLCRNHIRAQCRRVEQLSESLDLYPTAQDDFSVSTLRMSLEQTLDSEDYALLNAYCIEERPPEELCEEYGLSPVALRVRIHRLRKFLTTNFIFLVTFALHQNI